jgi:hypothetical protein
MEGERIPKRVLIGKFHNKRSVGKPRTRWEAAVQRDALQNLVTRCWRRRGRGREE